MFLCTKAAKFDQMSRYGCLHCFVALAVCTKLSPCFKCLDFELLWTTWNKHSRSTTFYV